MLAVLYAQIGMALVLAWKARQALRLDPTRFACLAAEVLACPPHAANLLRKLSLGMAHADDLSGAASRLMDPATRAALYRQCRARLAAHIAQFEPDDPQVIALGRLRRHFAAGDP